MSPEATRLNVPEGSDQVWGEGERPSWLVPDELQPKKREWSPARDRMEAELELRARMLEQRHLRRRNRLRFLILPYIWILSLVQALVDVGRNKPDIAEEARRESSAERFVEYRSSKIIWILTCNAESNHLNVALIHVALINLVVCRFGRLGFDLRIVGRGTLRP